MQLPDEKEFLNGFSVMKTRTLFITSFHPLVTRNILATPLVAILAAEPGRRVILIGPEKKRRFFTEQFAGGNILFEGISDRLSRRDYFLRYLSLAVLDTATLRIKRAGELAGSGAWMSRLVGNRPIGRALARGASSFLTPRAEWPALFERHRPDAVFSTDAQNEFDLQMLHEAARRGVRTVAMVRSWDNLTSKGLLRFLPDVLAVHNEIISREAQTLHGVPAAQIRVVGIPHYDRYVRPAATPWNEFCRRIGADPVKKLILYVPTGDRYLSPNTLDREIVTALDRRLGPTYQLLVRFPPSDTVAGLDRARSRGRIIFDAPSATVKFGALTRDDDQHLIDTLFWSRVVIAGPSTMCVDAAVFDKPVVLINFDGSRKLDFYQSIRRYWAYDHLRPIIASGGGRLVGSMDELIDWIERCAAHPEQDRQGRKKIVEEQAGFTDGRSCERLAEVLLAA